MEVANFDVEYIDEIHTYLINGVITPSVSEIIRFIYPNKYSDIPKSVLEEKALFGTHVHNAIECYENQEDFELTPREQLCFEQYLKLKEKYQIEVLEQETIIHYQDRFAGRLDMIATVQEQEALIDIKTTSKLDYESLAWQLGLYALGYEFLYGITFDEFYCLWLPKGHKGELKQIVPKAKKEILEVLEEYEKQKNKSM